MRNNLAISAKRIVVKVGSSLLTTSSGYLSPSKVKNIVDSVSSLVDTYNKEIILVSSGSIACGMSMLKLKKRPSDLALLQAAAAVGQGALIHLYQEAFKQKGYQSAQILLTGDGLLHRDRYLNARNTINALLRLGAIPIVNENDTVTTDEIRFGDNDSLASQVALMSDADLLVILSDVDGFYVKEGQSKTVLHQVDKIDHSLKEHLEKHTSSRSVGGMHSKLETAFMLMHLGLPLIIANGNRKNVLDSIVQGNTVGTLFVPKGDKKTSKKRWLAFTAKSKTAGSIVLDDGACDALSKKGKSLLARGIVDVVGDFNFGDAINIVNTKGDLFAKGITNFSSEDIVKIKGQKSSAINKILDKGSSYDEVIHCDNLIVLA